MASHYIDNPASGRVLAKAGFLYTGEVRELRSMARGSNAQARMMVCMA
jgi:RimJ/RimL family protein N-acetyltransferase